MVYLEQNQNKFKEILININIDRAGYHKGPSAFLPNNLPDDIKKRFDKVLDSNENIHEGGPWYQGDHSIFIQQGVPAKAVTSQWFPENIDSQESTYTPKDQAGIVNCDKLLVITENCRFYSKRLPGLIIKRGSYVRPFWRN